MSRLKYKYGIDSLHELWELGSRTRLGGRIKQGGTVTEYFLGDALGSVRQLTDQAGVVTLAKAYTPYGETLSTAGSGVSAFAYTGEQVDPNGLVYLRARYYSPLEGRFLSRDTWDGDVNRPLSLNRWNFVHSNPITYRDPTGHIREDRTEALEALQIYGELSTKYSIFFDIDWGYYGYDDKQLRSFVPLYDADVPVECRHTFFGWMWREGQWSIDDLRAIRAGVGIMSQGVRTLGGRFNSLIGSVTIKPDKYFLHMQYVDDPTSTAKPGRINWRVTNNQSDQYRLHVIIHEMGHIVHLQDERRLTYFMNALGAKCFPNPSWCNSAQDRNSEYILDPYYSGDASEKYGYEHMPSRYAGNGNMEDFAETWREVVTKAYLRSGDTTYLREARLAYNYSTNNHKIGERRSVMTRVINGLWSGR
jgi:RHS repeat-associated protein